MKKLIPVVLVFLLLLSGCSSLFWAAVVGSAISDTPDPSDDTSVPANTPKQTDAPKPTAKPTPEPPKALTYGDTFEFDGFEITFLPEYDFTTIDNKFSDLDGHDVIIYSLSGTNPTCIRHGGRALRKARFHGVSGGPPSALEDSA